MLKCLYHEFQLSFNQGVNQIIYSIINFRPLRGLISEEWYVRRDIKRVLGIFWLIWRALVDIFKKLSYFLLVICVPTLIMKNILKYNQAAAAGSILWSFFFLNCMFGSFVHSHIVTSGTQEQYVLLNLLRIDARKYFLTEILWEYGKQTIYYSLLFFTIGVKIWHCPARLVLWLMICYICFRPIGEAVRLKLCERYGIPFYEYSKAAEGGYYNYCIVIVLLAYGCYPVLSLVQGTPGKVYNPVFDAGLYSTVILGIILILAAAAGVWAVRYLRSYPDYTQVARRMYNLSRINEAVEAAETAKSAAYQFDEDDVEESELCGRIFQDKQGYDYLHALFFYRHKKLVGRQVRIKTFLAGLVFGVGGIALVVANLLLSASDFQSMSSRVWTVINQCLPILVFIMYCASSGQSLTQAMFYNCDASLLKYGYYRVSDAILTSFRIRLWYMLRAELPMAGMMCGGFLVDALLLRRFGNLWQILAVMCCIASLTVFFSIVFLCMYYIFQPFTEGGNITGVGYKICTAGLYFLSYMCLQIKTPPAYFAVLLLTVTVLVMFLSMVLVWRMAPRTFHLK